MACHYLDNYLNGIGNDPSSFDIPDITPTTVAGVTESEVAVVFPTFVLSPGSTQPIRLRSSRASMIDHRGMPPPLQGTREFLDPLGYDSDGGSDDEISPAELEAAMKLLVVGKLPRVSQRGKFPGSAHEVTSRSAPGMSLVDQIVHRFVKHLVNKGIKIVAWDFDDTISSKDYQMEYFTVPNICQRISPLFVKISTALLENNIGVAMVTYNSNPLIGPAVSELLDANIPVFFRADHEIDTGKGWHLTQAIRFYNDLLGIAGTTHMITSKNVLLIDDQPDNIEIARENGYSCIHNKSVVTLDDFINFIEH